MASHCGASLAVTLIAVLLKRATAVNCSKASKLTYRRGAPDMRAWLQNTPVVDSADNVASSDLYLMSNDL